MPQPSILQTAITAYQEGLCPIPVMTNGSKRPAVNWKLYQYERPDLAQVQAWFTNAEGLGIVTRAFSERVICLDIEGRFGPQWEQLVAALTEAGLWGAFSSWCEGYTERTPSGGLHVLVHYGGDGPVPGNTKIALDPERETLIETRGEGGFVIIAPSNGRTHPSGEAWRLTHGGFDSIAWCTPEEYEAVVSLLGQRFDACPPVPIERDVAGKLLRSPGRMTLVAGESWINEMLASYDPIETVLERWGWQYLRTEGRGSLWRRPNKDTPGHSARINEAGRLIVFSSATPFEMQPRSYDALDVDIIMSLGRTPGREEMLTERTEWLRRRRPTITVSSPVGTVDDDPRAGDELCLPSEFWSARPWLQQIHDVALEHILSPEGVLGAFLSCYATTVPMSIKLPGIVGVASPLNCYVALVDRSGGGKTTSMALALELLGYPENLHPDVLLGRGLRSGEGLITLAMRPKTKDDPDPGHRQGIQVVFDEGGALGAQASRQGSTTLPYLNTAWAGINIVGGAKATESASFSSAQVRVCVVMGVQYGACANLFTGEAEAIGFPQRLLYFGLENPVLATMQLGDVDDAPAAPVDVKLWEHGEYGRTPIVVPPHIRMEVREWARARKVPSTAGIRLDGHQMLLRLRTAALFALMDGRGALDDQDTDWSLAAQVCATSRAVRTSLVDSIGDVAVERHRALGRLDTVRQDAADGAWLDGKVQLLLSHLSAAEGGLTRKELRSKLRNTFRPRIDEILDHGVARGRIVHKDDRYWGGTR